MAGFDYLALSEPIQNKRWHRVGWVAFKNASDIPAAMSVLCESTVSLAMSCDERGRLSHSTSLAQLADFTLHMAPLDKLFTVRIKAAPGVMNTVERLRKDLDQIRRVATGFEKDEGDSRGSAVIEEQFAKLTNELESTREEVGDEEIESKMNALVSLVTTVGPNSR